MLRKLIDCHEFQRLRHIRQNGLTNLVFHGAEHSRFTHSVGVAFLAQEMLDRVILNKDDPQPDHVRIGVTAAALLHDLGHGPFSHTLEEVCKAVGVDLDHEDLTVRLIVEETAINEVLVQVDRDFPEYVASFIDRARRKEDHWTYRLVSSQLDADRLDYMQRDARNAGLKGYDFDLPRLLDCLEHLDKKRIAVDRRALAAVELYLVALDKLYSSVYYHHAIRAATVLLRAVMQRAVDLHRSGDGTVLPAANPLRALIDRGSSVSVHEYTRLTEFQVWYLIDSWIDHQDRVLSDLSRRLMKRRLFKTLDLDPSKYSQTANLKERAERAVRRHLDFVDADFVRYYVHVDEPSRTSYKTYDWRAEAPDESIWMVGGGGKPCAVENEELAIVSGLKDTRYFQRLVFPHEIVEEIR